MNLAADLTPSPLFSETQIESGLYVGKLPIMAWLVAISLRLKAPIRIQ